MDLDITRIAWHQNESMRRYFKSLLIVKSVSLVAQAMIALVQNKDKTMAFKKGNSGNPDGRPKGTPDKRTSLRSLLEPHAAELVKQLVDMAKEGDMTAMRLVIDRLIPPVRENKLDVQIPDVTDIAACSAAQAKILSAVATGELFPAEGEALSGLVENRRKSLEANELEDRIAALELKTG
jgi:hypothetical protein